MTEKDLKKMSWRCIGSFKADVERIVTYGCEDKRIRVNIHYPIIFFDSLESGKFIQPRSVFYINEKSYDTYEEFLEALKDLEI